MSRLFGRLLTYHVTSFYNNLTMKEEGLQPPRSSLDPSGGAYSDCSSGQLNEQTRHNVQNPSREGGGSFRSAAEATKAEEGTSLGTDSDKSHALSARYVAYLGCIKDNWSSCHAAKLLDENLIAYLRPRFVLLSTPLKVRVLTSFLYIKPDLVSRALLNKKWCPLRSLLPFIGPLKNGY